MTYYITWITDGFEAPLLTAVSHPNAELSIDKLMALAAIFEEVELDAPYEICSIIRAEKADVIF